MKAIIISVEGKPEEIAALAAALQAQMTWTNKAPANEEMKFSNITGTLPLTKGAP